MWVQFNVKAATKVQLRQLAVMRWTEVLYNAAELPTISEEMKSETKPEAVSPGCTLKFFPTDDEVIAVVNARKAQTGAGKSFQLPPWAEQIEDQPPARWANHNLLACMFLPRLTAEGKIDYFPSYLHQIEGRNEQTTPGRFIRLFWETLDGIQDGYATKNYGRLTDDVLRTWTEIPKVQTAADVKFATTPEDIERVYLTGPSSCMTKPASHFASGGTHPVRMYGAGDLAVAYITKRRGEGITQRAMCWPAKKIYSRIYGTGPLEGFLKELGFTVGKFDGARLLKVKTDANRFILPYVDYHDYVVERKDHLVIFHKEDEHPLVEGLKVTRDPRTKWNYWPAQATTSGVVEARRKCQKCTKVLTPSEHSQGHECCKKCRSTQQRCPECGRYHDLDAPGWVRLTTRDAAQGQLTWEALVTRGMAVGYCPTCAPQRKREVDRMLSNPDNGYYLIKPRDKDSGTHAAQS